MKTNHSYLYATFCIAVLLLFSTAQSLYAAPEKMQIKQQVEKLINLYCPQELSVKVTEEGLVQIKGTVPVLYDRLRAYDIVSKVQGVRKIENEIVVQTSVMPDKIIEASIVEKLGINQAISDPARIDVAVNNGVVFLSGAVNYYHEKLIANSIASWEKGVTGIEDQLKVMPNSNQIPDDQQLLQVLQYVLQDQFPNEERVSVSAHDGVVTLEGVTRTLWTEDQMVEELSSILGVQKVISNLKLSI